MNLKIKNVIIVGSSGHSKVVIDIFEMEGKYKILGLLDAYRKKGEDTLGYKILGKEEDLPELIVKYPKFAIFIAIGDNWVRHNVRNKIISIIPDMEFATAIHPSVHIAKSVKIGKGVVVMTGSVLNSASNIGDFSIINTHSIVGHDGVVEQFSSLAPNVTTGGDFKVGEFTAISIGAIILHARSIGYHSVIGAGAVVVKNMGNNIIAFGMPAKVIRKREIGEKYL